MTFMLDETVIWYWEMQYLSLLPLLRFSGYQGPREVKPTGPRVSSAKKLENWYTKVHAKILKFPQRFTVFESRYLGCLVSNVLQKPSFVFVGDFFALKYFVSGSGTRLNTTGAVLLTAWLIYAGILQAYTLTTHPPKTCYFYYKNTVQQGCQHDSLVSQLVSKVYCGWARSLATSELRVQCQCQPSKCGQWSVENVTDQFLCLRIILVYTLK